MMFHEQALSMSNEARKTTTVGEIVNLMSVDAQRLQDAVGYLWMIWSAPLQIAIAVYMLWRLLGISTLAGLAVMIVLIPLNGIIVKFSRNYQVIPVKYSLHDSLKNVIMLQMCYKTTLLLNLVDIETVWSG